MYYINCFFVYSIFGFLLETIFAFFTKSGFNSGFLYGPWTPIYGIGVVVILLLSNYLFLNLHMSRIEETIIVLIILSIFLTCLELLGGILIEKVFHVSFWDYSDKIYHIGKYICLQMTLIWGIASTIFIYIINPLLTKYISKIPTILTVLLGIFMIIDLIFTLINGISINNKKY